MRGSRLSVALAAPLLGAGLAAPVWVPGWAAPVEWLAGLLALFGLGAAVAWGARRVRRAWRERRRAAGTARLAGAIAAALALVLASGSLGIFGQWRVFPPVFARRLEAAGTTVYVYDASFLDPEVEVRTRRGPWPVTRWLSGSGVCRPDDVALAADGFTLHVCHRDCDLRTRRCVDAY